MKGSTLMRVPKVFKDEVDSIARSRNKRSAEFLREDGVRIFRNARALTDLLFGKR